MKKSNEELKKIILEKGSGDSIENERIYGKFFRDWQERNSYIYNRFNLNFDNKILDIGCGYGHNIIHFSENSVGIEINPKLSEYARSLGLNILDINAEDSLKKIESKFDLIWCTDFLVHMVSPYKFLYDCNNLLNPSGHLVIQIPLMSVLKKHRSSCHFYAFNRKALLYLIEMAGYKVLKTSGFMRRLPKFINLIFEPLFQYFGGNIWVLAEKRDSAPINSDKVFLPEWFINKI